MICKEIYQQIWQIQLKTRKILSGTMVGTNRTANKGAGFDFDQVRDYAQGDDLRFIDWKSTARVGKLLTKQYYEERNHNIMIALDVSQSSFVGNKYKLLSNLAAVFAIVAEYSKDNVGLTLFSDQINLKVPIKNGRTHVFSLMEQIFGYQPIEKNGTNLTLLLNDLAKSLKQKTLIILISDLIDSSEYQVALKTIKMRHDLILARCLASYEQQMPSLGIVPIIDPETGETGFLDARKSKTINLILQERLKRQDLLIKNSGVDLLQINDEAQMIPEVIKFFRKRLVY